MNHLNAQRSTLVGAGINSASEAPRTPPEIEAETNRLRSAAQHVESLFGELAMRLHSVRVSEPPTVSAVSKDTEPQTPLGSQLRGISDGLTQLSANIAYHLRTVALPD